MSRTELTLTPPHEIADTTVHRTLEDQDDAMRSWLCSGPGRSPGGAFCAWVDEATGEPGFEYPEITGYALTYLAGLDALTGAEESAARGAARWLAARIDGGDLSAHAGWDSGVIYTFDLAMVSAGLISIGSRLDLEGAVAHGMALAQLVRDETRAPGGLASIASVSTSRSSRPGTWSNDGEAHLLKCVQCLLLAGELGLEGAVEAAAGLIERGRTLQSDDGRFETIPGRTDVWLHPHLYAAEGLWMWGTAQADTDALDRSAAAVRWAQQHQLDTGGFARAVDPGHGEQVMEQCDATAQAARLGALHEVGADATSAARARLRSVARTSPSGSAIPYQPAALPVHLNTWATLFGAQALAGIDTLQSESGWRFLV